MGNVNMEATQINDRTGASKMSVAQHLKSLDAIASAIEGLPTFTSNDRAFLEELPAFPSEDGKKALVATTESGTTSLNYEEIESSCVDYSTTEQHSGQKWIDGKDIYFITVVFPETIALTVNSWVSLGINAATIDTLVNAVLYFDGGVRIAECRIMDNLIKAMSVRTAGSSDTFDVNKIVIFYTKK